MDILDKIQVIKHSCVRIDCGKIIYIDPFLMNGAPHDADIILVTHPHFDHFSIKDIRKVMKEDTVIAGPKMIAVPCKLLTGKDIIAVTPGQKTMICGINIEVIAAYNTAATRPHKRFLNWVGYVVDTPEGRIYVTGDTDDIPEARAVSCDVLMLPVGGSNYTMTAEEAAALTNAIRPETVIPIHYGALLGGEDAPMNFKAKLDKDIRCEIRDTVYSNAMILAYTVAAAMILLIIALYLFFR